MFIKRLFLHRHADQTHNEENDVKSAAQQQSAVSLSGDVTVDNNDNEMSDNMQNSAQATSVAGHWNKVFKPRFEIELYDEVTSDETGEPTGQWKKVVTDRPIIIEAASKADLAEHANRFAILHQKMKVIRKVSDGKIPQDECQRNTDNKADANANDSGKSKSCAIANDKKRDNSKVIDVDVSQNANVAQSPDSIQCSSSNEVDVKECYVKKPKFYRIGDIEIKDDNGKIYQKQWMKLSSHEAANFRIVNDKNNAIVNLAGKSIEMKRWVRVEKTDDETASLEDSLNG